VRRGDIDDAPPAVLFHIRHRKPAGMQCARQINGDNRIPLVDREFLDRVDVLNAGIVHQYIDTAEFGAGPVHHVFDLVRIGDVGI